MTSRTVSSTCPKLSSVFHYSMLSVSSRAYSGICTATRHDTTCLHEVEATEFGLTAATRIDSTLRLRSAGDNERLLYQDIIITGRRPLSTKCALQITYSAERQLTLTAQSGGRNARRLASGQNTPVRVTPCLVSQPSAVHATAAQAGGHNARDSVRPPIDHHIS